MSETFGPMKLDFSSFYKFVASVGLILITASVALPWFVLSASFPDAPESTPAGKLVKLALDERAEQYLFIVQYYPWLSIVLFVFGIALSFYGLYAWRRRQKLQDADEDEAFRQRRKLGETTRATQDERDEKLNKEAQDESTEEELTVSEEGPPLHEAEKSTSESSPVPNRSAAKRRMLARRELIQETENRVGELLNEGFGESHVIESSVRIGSQSQILDFVVRALDSTRWTSFAVEIKVSSRSSFLSRRLFREMMLSVAIAARNVPEGKVQVERVGRPPIAKSVSVCIVLVADPELENAAEPPSRHELSFEDYVKNATETIQITNSVLSRQVGVIILPQSRFQDLSSAWMRQSILDVIQCPESPVAAPS